MTRRSTTRLYGIEAALGRPPYTLVRFNQDQTTEARTWVACAPTGFRRRLFEFEGLLGANLIGPRRAALLIERHGDPLSPWLVHHAGRIRRTVRSTMAAVRLAEEVF